MARKKTVVNDEPVIVKGSHLTVTKFPDGKTTLEWDDEALLRDIREATASVSKPKKSKKTK